MPELEPCGGFPTAMIRTRMSAYDAHYGGNLVDGARMLQLFGDVGTELIIRLDGDELTLWFPGRTDEGRLDYPGLKSHQFRRK